MTYTPKDDLHNITISELIVKLEGLIAHVGDHQLRHLLVEDGQFICCSPAQFFPYPGSPA